MPFLKVHDTAVAVCTVEVYDDREDSCVHKIRDTVSSIIGGRTQRKREARG